MPNLSRAEAIECFHLAFLNVLPSHVRRGNYVVKGGANLRYFYRSHRYSEDIDFDAVPGEGWKLSEQVDGALTAKALELLLRRYDISVASINKAKQTETTRRWKLLLSAPGHDRPISTRVELSARDGDERFDLETVDENVTKPYGILRPSLQRYRPDAATEQKVDALALRNETQTRDVFDLDLLFRGNPGALDGNSLPPSRIARAADNCAAVGYDAYRAQVVPFLEPAIATIYGTEEAWAQIKTAVFEELTRADALG